MVFQAFQGQMACRECRAFLGRKELGEEKVPKGEIGDKGLEGMPGPRGNRGREGPPRKSGPPGNMGIIFVLFSIFKVSIISFNRLLLLLFFSGLCF